MFYVSNQVRVTGSYYPENKWNFHPTPYNVMYLMIITVQSVVRIDVSKQDSFNEFN